MKLFFPMLLSIILIHCSAQENISSEAEDLSDQIAPPGQMEGVFMDPRDSIPYRWIRLADSQVWMVDNLKFKVQDSWCYENNDSLCTSYGRLYTWEAAKEACPEGWHLPSDEEWKSLALNNGGYYNYETLKSVGDGELSYAALIDSSEGSFSAQLGGLRSSPNYFELIDRHGSYWSSYEHDYSKAWTYQFRIYKFLGRYTQEKDDASSCRCVLGPKHKSAPYYSYGTFTDTRDDQSYAWVRLKDGKKWMAQNLNFTTNESWCYNDMDQNCSEYGRLYTWKAAQKACPEGWRLPSDEEWWTMANYYGVPENEYEGQPITDGSKETSAVRGLHEPGETSFSPQRGGIRFSNKMGFNHLGDFGYYWSSTSRDKTTAFHYDFIHGPYLRRYGLSKDLAMACRCIQD